MDFFFVFRASRYRAIRRVYKTFHESNTAEARGRRLLRGWLSAEQRAQFDAVGYFEVVGRQTAKRYRIHYGTSANVHEVDAAGNLEMGWCFAPEGFLVPGDVMLAQKIALETDELAALAVANSFAPGMYPVRVNRRPF
jgi:hypothetical protein